MIQIPEWRENSDYSAAGSERRCERSLEQQLMLLPKALHYELLDYFCCLNFAQRRNFILETLNSLGINHQLQHSKKAAHIVVYPDYELDSKTHDLFKTKYFVAHYDAQIPGGRKDNIAAVWHLLNLAAQMKRECPRLKTPMQIIFTDRGELCSGPKSNHCGHGSRGKNSSRHRVFFVFDNCGIGDRLCYLPNIITDKKILAQQECILKYLQKNELRDIEVEKISEPQYYFSDNIDFNLCGYPALLLSTMFQKDINSWRAAGQKPAARSEFQDGNSMPNLLEAHSFALMNQVLSRLCRA